MRTAAICIVIVIVALALAGAAAVAIPVLTYSPPVPVAYEGTLLGFYDQHAELLNAAAEILWQHPTFFDQHRVPGEHGSNFLACDILEERWHTDHSMLTEAEWQTLRLLFETTEVTSIEYYDGGPPEVSFHLRTLEDELCSLHYICTEEYTDCQVLTALWYYGQFYSRFEQLTDPRWYAAYPEEDWICQNE